MTPDLSRAVWRKASQSGGNGGECVELARPSGAVGGVRDSKNPAVVLTVNVDALIKAVKGVSSTGS